MKMKAQMKMIRVSSTESLSMHLIRRRQQQNTMFVEEQ